MLCDHRSDGNFPSSQGFCFLESVPKGGMPFLSFFDDFKQTMQVHKTTVILLGQMTHRLFRSRCSFFVFFSGLFLTVGCGYSFQSSKNPLYLKEGVQKIYVEPLVNNTYKAGVENIVYNNLIRILSSHGRVTLVRNRSDSDAVLQGAVQSANYGGSAGAAVSGLNPAGLADSLRLPTKDYVVSTEYAANLICSFSLVRSTVMPGKAHMIWAAQFSRSKPFPGANQLDVPGTTSALINESEFERALSEMAYSMMDDVHESMLAMF